MFIGSRILKFWSCNLPTSIQKIQKTQNVCSFETDGTQTFCYSQLGIYGLVDLMLCGPKILWTCLVDLKPDLTPVGPQVLLISSPFFVLGDQVNCEFPFPVITAVQWVVSTSYHQLHPYLTLLLIDSKNGINSALNDRNERPSGSPQTPHIWHCLRKCYEEI